MFFGSNASPWRAILGILALATGAQRIAALVMLSTDGRPSFVTVGVALQAFAALGITIGLFAETDRLVAIGALVAGAGILVGLTGGLHADHPEVGLHSVGGGLALVVLVVLAVLARSFGRFASPEDASEGSDGHARGARAADDRAVLAADHARDP